MSWESISALLATVWSWIQPSKIGVLLAGVLFAVLIVITSRFAGLSQNETLAGVVVVVILCVGVWTANNLTPSPLLSTLTSWGYSILFFAFSATLLWGFVRPIIFPVLLTPELARYESEFQFIDRQCGTPTQMLTPGNLPVTADGDAKLTMSMNRVWTWVGEGLKSFQRTTAEDGSTSIDNTRRPLVLRSKAPFAKHYDDIHISVLINDEYKIEDGVVFLQSSEIDKIVYRQMPTKFDITSENAGGEFTLYKPAPGEVLFAILRIRKRDGTAIPVDASCDTIGLTLKVAP